MKKILKSFGFYAFIFAVLATLAFTTPQKSMVGKAVANTEDVKYFVPVDPDDPSGDYVEYTGNEGTISIDCPDPYVQICVVRSHSGTMDAAARALVSYAINHQNGLTPFFEDGLGNKVWLYTQEL